MNIEVVKVGDLKIVPNELVRNFIFYLDEKGYGNANEEFQKMDFSLEWVNLLKSKDEFLYTFNHNDYDLVDFNEFDEFVNILVNKLVFVDGEMVVDFSFEYWFCKVNKFGRLEYKFLEKC